MKNQYNDPFETHYPITHLPVSFSGRDGGKLTNTLAHLSVGDAFFYPGEHVNSLYRAASREGIKIRVENFDPGFSVTRVD